MTKITCRIADVAEVRAGYITKKPVKPRPDGTHNLLQIRDFRSDRAVLDTSRMVHFIPDSLSSVRPLQTGEVVFLARGARNFAYAVADLSKPTIAAACFFVIHPEEHVLPEYLAWYLNQPATLRALSRAATSGARMPVVRRADIENVHVSIPPIPVQQAIMQIDVLMRDEQALLNDLARKRRGLISAVCMAATNPERPIGERS